MAKYYLDSDSFNRDVFILRDTESLNTIYRGSFSDLEIENNDPEYTNKLDEFFQNELNISPAEWEVG